VNLATTSLGEVLVDGNGMTLYVFTPDSAGDSTCYDDCEASWPVLAGDSVTAGDGLAAADFGTTTRTDGSSQVTFKGWPLYYFAGDKAAGDVAGQGLGDKWYVVDAAGTMIGAEAASPAAEGGATVNVASTSLGDVLVDGSGLTLYIFTADGGGKSSCSGDCLVNWPALISDAAPTLGAGLDAASFGSITRDDGATQVTFFDMPLYYFAGDKAAGDVAGQGLAEKWYVVKADGTVVK
jgi:predicted lipoprotein with Yx(FWY)xxD motif